MSTAAWEHRTHLRQLLTTRFDESELRTLCFDLGIEYDDLIGTNKADKARELISYLERHGRIVELLTVGKQLRPDITWRQEPPDCTAHASLAFQQQSVNDDVPFVQRRTRLGPFLPVHARYRRDNACPKSARIASAFQNRGRSMCAHTNDVECGDDDSTDQLQSGDRQELLAAYQRMLMDQVYSLSLADMSDLGGLGLPLADLYVERILVPLRPDAVRYDWGRIQATPYPPDGATLIDLIRTPRARILLEGGPACGKSISLRRLALTCLGEDTLKRMDNGGASWAGSPPLPILLSAREVAATLHLAHALALECDPPTPSTFWTAIAEWLRFSHLDMLVPTIQQSLDAGDCLVMIDGLDDLTEAAHPHAFIAALGHFIACYPDNRYIVTCRDHAAYPIDSLASLTQYALGPLDEAQVDTMVERWYTAIVGHSATLVPEDLPERIALLLGYLRANDRLRDLVGSPLGLAHCILSHVEGWQLTELHPVVCRRLIDLLLDRWEHIRTGGGAPTLAQALDLDMLITPDQRLALLQPLALAFQSYPHQDADQGAALHETEVIRLLCASLVALGVDHSRAAEQLAPRLLAWCCRHGLLFQSDSSSISMMSCRPLREYLTARVLAEASDFPVQAKLLRHDPRWQVTLLLAASMLGRGAAAHHTHTLLEPLLAPVQSLNNGDVEALLFAAACFCVLDHTAEQWRTLHAAVQDWLGLLLDTPRPVAERVRAGLLLGQLGDSRFADLLPPVVWIAGGRFVLGSDEGYADEGPVQWADVPGFAIGVYPVTNQEYARFLNETPSYPRPRYWYDLRFNNPAQPVVGVTWHDANAYCAWLTARLNKVRQLRNGMIVRLPQEIEWEKAASWDPDRLVKRRYPWGDTWSSTQANSAAERGDWMTTPVGCYPDGVSAYGVHDMIGNVWEWTADTYMSFAGSTAPFHKRDRYTLRGSSCASLPIHMRCTYRSRLLPTSWRYHLGFRIVLACPLCEA